MLVKMLVMCGMRYDGGWRGSFRGRDVDCARELRGGRWWYNLTVRRGSLDLALWFLPSCWYES